jgi:hypothetical protein
LPEQTPAYTNTFLQQFFISVHNKLECLSLASLSSLFVGQGWEPTLEWSKFENVINVDVANAHIDVFNIFKGASLG